MTWAWGLIGLFGLGMLGFAVWWLISLGKKIHAGQDAAKHNVELERQAKEKNTFIKDVDQITKGKDALKRRARDAFRRGNVGDLLRVLDESHKSPSSKKTNSST